jgi:hypothetical protein
MTDLKTQVDEYAAVLTNTELSMMMEYDSLLSMLPGDLMQLVADKFAAWREERSAALAKLLAITHALVEEREAVGEYIAARRAVNGDDDATYERLAAATDALDATHDHVEEVRRG